MGNTLRSLAWLAAFILGVALTAVQLSNEKSRYANWALHDHAHRGEEHKPQRIFEWEPEEAQALVLRSRDGRELHFVRDAGQWHGKGITTTARSFDPTAYLSMLSQARKDREFEPEPGTLAAFGLAPAQMQVQVRHQSGSLLADLAVGELTPDGFGRYVLMPPAARVLIIPNYQFEPAIESLRP